MLGKLSIVKTEHRDVKFYWRIALHDIVAFCLKTYKDMLVSLQNGLHRLAQLLCICIGRKTQYPGDVILRVIGIIDAVHIDTHLRERQWRHSDLFRYRTLNL